MFKKGDFVTGIKGDNAEFGVFQVLSVNHVQGSVTTKCLSSECWEFFLQRNEYKFLTRQLTLLSADIEKEHKSSLEFIFSISK